jgi:hypothetical protein
MIRSTVEKNLWTTSGATLARWTADLGVPDDPPRLWRWLHRVLAAGEEHDVYRVLEAPAAGFTPAAGVPLDAWLDRLWQQDGVLDLGHFAWTGTVPVDGRTFRASARLTWLDAAGTLVEGRVDNLGALLRSVLDVPDEVAGRSIVDCPPLDVEGPRVDVRHPERSRRMMPPGRVVVHVAVRSDIWSPWVSGLLAEPDRAGWQDNRLLAGRHTPRLNAFLAAAREATAEAGGRWEVYTEAPFAKLGLVTEAGFDLDAPNPVPGEREA